MGFYRSQQIIRDARDRSVKVRTIAVARGDWDCTLEVDDPGRAPALRLGLRLVKGLGEHAPTRLVSARPVSPFASTADLVLRTQLSRPEL